MGFMSKAYSFASLYDMHLIELLIWWIINLCISVSGNAAFMASMKTLSPSTNAMMMSFTPLFLGPFSTVKPVFRRL